MNIKGAQLLLVLSIALMGCSESPDEELIFEGQHINYYSSAGTTQVCEGSFYVQDVFVASVANYFGVELPEPVNFIFTQKNPVPVPVFLTERFSPTNRFIFMNLCMPFYSTAASRARGHFRKVLRL